MNGKNMSDNMNKDRKTQSITPAPLPGLPPRLARTCRACGSPFETRCYAFEHCERCSVARMLAVSAYARHESAWEERQRQADALSRQAIANANARWARQKAFLARLSWGVVLAALGLLGLAWAGQ